MQHFSAGIPIKIIIVEASTLTDGPNLNTDVGCLYVICIFGALNKYRYAYWYSHSQDASFLTSNNIRCISMLRLMGGRWGVCLFLLH